MTKVWNHLVSFQLNVYQCFDFSISKPGLKSVNDNILQHIFASFSNILN